MKLVFLIYRLGYYRFFAPLIKEGLKRGYQIECWHDYSQPRTGKKGYSFPDIKYIHNLCCLTESEIKTFKGDEELEKLLLKDKDINVVFSIHMSGYKFNKETLGRFPFHWARIMTGADSFFELHGALMNNIQPNSKETFFVYSENWLKRGRDYLKTFFPGYSNFLDGAMKCNIVGNVEFDAFAEIDKNKVREKYKIPPGKEILLYLPFPYDNRAKNSAWERAFCGMFSNTAKSKDGQYIHGRKMHPVKNFISKTYSLYRIFQDRCAWKYWINGINEKAVFESVRDYCDKNNLFLVVKPRLKFPVSEIVIDKADLAVWDDDSQQDPPVLKELLSVSKLTMSFFSSSVLSSIAAGVFHLNVRLPEVFFENDRQKFFITDEDGSHFNFDGVCASWTIEDVISKLKNTHSSYFTIKQNKRYEYMIKHLGFDDHKASQRVFDALNNYER